MARTAFEIQPLEPRLLLAATPGEVLTKEMRQTLLSGMNLPNKASLQYKLNTNNLSGFDQQLLDYMADVTHAQFFFDPADVDSYVSYIQGAGQNTGDIIARADAVMNNLYPEQDGSSEFSVLVPEDVDWDEEGYSSNPETIHALNRHVYWIDLAMAYRFTGDISYAEKIVGQLGDWSSENPPLADWNTWRANDPHWSRLDTATRAESWSWTYSLLLDSPAWTSQANTLFLVKMREHAEYLYVVDPPALTSNQAMIHAQGLLYISLVFPQFSQSATWETYSRELLFDSVDTQFYADGSHFEQSPNYAVLVLDRLLETKLLDEKNGNTWPQARTDNVTAAVDALYQMLSPDGKTPAIGDTYRASTVTIYLKASLVQDETKWSEAKPRVRDTWLFGPSVVSGYTSNPVTPAMETRPSTYALEDSGNYIMRSGSDANARQLIFDAGPKGGGHGHYDLLGFELFGYGRPLIADPGPYKYEDGAARTWAISTPAHNTVSLDSLNHGTLEGTNNPGIVVDEWNVQSGFVQVTAHHSGYSFLSGSPVITRSIWYDYDGTMLVVDWVDGAQSHDARSSFLIPGTSTSRNLAEGWMRSTNASGRNVQIQSLLQPGQMATYRTADIFTSSNRPPNESDPAIQFFVYQSGAFVCFATLITAYDGTTPPDVSAQLLTTPAAGESVQIQLTKNGTPQTITFTPQQLEYPTDDAVRGWYSDVKYDSAGRLHWVFMDRDDKTLKYTVRGTNGAWSAIQTIDDDVLAGYEPSMAIDGNGRIGVAYTYAQAGDLRYAFFNGTEWTVQEVDIPGSTGHYPSLVYSRNNGAIITYYNKTKGDLRVAMQQAGGWEITTLDAGTVGTKDVGRFSHVLLDPTRPTASKLCIAYEDTGGQRYMYAVQGLLKGGVQNNGYTFFTVATATKLGGYVSLAFDSASRPGISFYDSAITGLRYASSSGSTSSGIKFTAATVADKHAVGYYSNLIYDSADRPTIFYFDRTHNLAMRAAHNGTRWNFTELAPGGRELHVTKYGNTLALTNLNESAEEQEVLFI